jgi:toxin ParE1/3/4
VSDVLAQADWYEPQSNRTLGVRWERAVTATTVRLAKTPRAGSPCSFSSPQLKDLRRLPIDDFPSHLVFYRIAQNQIHILRVVHGARDLETLVSE